MITVNPLEVEDGMFFTAICVELPKTNLLIISNEIGYIMCAALDVDLLSEKLADREVIAGRAVGVRTIDDLLHAPLEKVTHSAKEQYGWEEGMIGKDALIRIS
ncbi:MULTISPECIES: YunC family protein [Virgibacillus]|uniref:DUF1805 domain-containing protein n=2 Tax=Virgibacillus TaxID=84406 RepID=A0A024Q9M0_9BACI|nr:MULTISPECIES: DUF1805 domain-containing protein [Virgibacillus]EQB37317.1 hypothetical protein M948_01910 [Virgibacillus sp. CM-4]MYL40073.1 DUF1805 domain-containing protein [Virgibacillus massiliensis]GGJ62375.1 hypothetical protein GCM10007111_25610 [Virgibacillus kapii]CDQ39184.1 hypothetical protein BN990_01469 [Virgibacillus massiliensis]